MPHAHPCTLSARIPNLSCTASRSTAAESLPAVRRLFKLEPIACRLSSTGARCAREKSRESDTCRGGGGEWTTPHRVGAAVDTLRGDQT